MDDGLWCDAYIYILKLKLSVARCTSIIYAETALPVPCFLTLVPCTFTLGALSRERLGETSTSFRHGLRDATGLVTHTPHEQPHMGQPMSGSVVALPHLARVCIGIDLSSTAWLSLPTGLQLRTCRPRG
jgi:hypothetical protein